MKRQHFIPIACVSIMLAWPVPIHAQMSCPLVMPQHAVQIGNPPANWKARIAGSLRLTSVGILHGPFNGSGYLKPSQTELRDGAKGRTNTYTWNFGASHFDEKWLVCEYAGAVELYGRLADDTATCRITTTSDGRSVTKIALSCRSATGAAPP